MLGRAENELLTRVGPGTPMGELVRRFWFPGLLASRVPEPNGDPVRVRLVGENFVVWRDSDGRLGLFDEYCMHRGASLALGHCEGDGLRCLYHGWKYATDGTILDTPNYKKSGLRERLKAPTYPVREAGGLIWVYLGPAEKEPPFPHYKFMDLPAEHIPIYNPTFDCNFVQMMEGNLDSSHAHILHQDFFGTAFVKSDGASEEVNEANSGYTVSLTTGTFVSDDHAPSVVVDDMRFGSQGLFLYDAEADGRRTSFGRVYAWVMPFLTRGSEDAFVFSVPVDDDHTTYFSLLSWPIADKDERERYIAVNKAGPPSHYDEEGRYRWGPEERWGQDREAMRRGSFSGIEGVAPEDLAMITSMGPIYDRSRETMVPADALAIRMRRRLLEAARSLQDGKEPPQLAPEESLEISGGSNVVSDPAGWREAIVPGNERFRQEAGVLVDSGDG